MLILPTTKTRNGKARAQQMLRDVTAQRVHCTLVVFGEGDRGREIASRADRCAENDPFRHVIYVPDVRVLAGDAAFAVLVANHKAGEEAVALTIRFEVSSTLKGSAAIDFFELEQAFSRARAGQRKP
ncbi:MAG TPA: hypothetical protein VNO30_43405 [Kofleriaceae bacterium]|nr:hypothetical protein [Kofleriaceae bacterium]